MTQLNLSSGQKTQIRQIFTDTAAKVRSQKTSATAGTTGKGQGREMLQKVMAVLTEPQKTKLKSILHAGHQKAAGK